LLSCQRCATFIITLTVVRWFRIVFAGQPLLSLRRDLAVDVVGLEVTVITADFGVYG
jgi:hypothetical protein